MPERHVFFAHDSSRMMLLKGEHPEGDNRTFDYYRGQLGDWAGAKHPMVIATTMDEQIAGPAIDYANRSMYVVTRQCALPTVSRRRSLAVRRVKTLLRERPLPFGTVNTGTCANSSYVYALNRYSYDNETWTLLYSAPAADFPTATADMDRTIWKLAYDPYRHRIYWNVHRTYIIQLGVPARAVIDVVYLDLAPIEASGSQASASDVKLAFQLRDARQERHFSMDVSARDGAVYVADWMSIKKWDNSSSPAVTAVVSEAALLNRTKPSSVLHGAAGMVDPKGDRVDLTTRVPVAFCMAPPIDPTCAVHGIALDETSQGGPWLWYTYLATYSGNTFQVRKLSLATGRHYIVYSRVYYEFPIGYFSDGKLGTGMTLYSLSLDLVDRAVYVTMAGRNTVGRSLAKLPMEVRGGARGPEVLAPGVVRLVCRGPRVRAGPHAGRGVPQVA